MLIGLRVLGILIEKMWMISCKMSLGYFGREFESKNI